MEDGISLDSAWRSKLDLLVETYLHALRAADVETALTKYRSLRAVSKE